MDTKETGKTRHQRAATRHQSRQRGDKPPRPSAPGRFIGKFRCPTCKCVHHGLLEEDALAIVQSMNTYLSTISELECQQWYGGKTVSIDRFKRCFFCGTLSADFLPLDEKEKRASASHQPVIAPLINSEKHDAVAELRTSTPAAPTLQKHQHKLRHKE